jgi:hypothetical protein
MAAINSRSPKVFDRLLLRWLAMAPPYLDSRREPA